MALISPVGIKVSDEHKGAEILDIFSFHWADLPNVLFHDQRNVPGAGSNPTQLDLEESALAREATALYTWMPYMHNPKLMKRLEMVSVPTACAWGNMDKFTGREYARAYAGCVKSNELQVIDDAGHFPHIERPDEVAAFVAKTFG
jgi:pimeloyl-ACP methyl ester carboxylesterase